MILWQGKLDPAEKLDYVMNFSGGADPLLETGEAIDSWALAVTAPAAALGLEIVESFPYAPWLSEAGDEITLWLNVAPEFQQNAAYLTGVVLGIEVTIVTTSSPARTRQRTFGVEVKQL